MAEIGAVATIIQLISFSGEVLAAGYGYLSKVKKAPSEIRALLKETVSVNELLDEINELNEDKAEAKSGNVLSALAGLGVLDDCNTIMEAVKRMLKGCEEIEGQKARNMGKRLTWPFKEKDTKDLLGQLGRLRETLSAAVTVDSARTLRVVEEHSRRIDRKLISAMEKIVLVQDDPSAVKASTSVYGESVAYIKAATESRIEEDEKLAIRKWLYPENTNSDSRLKQSLELRHPETGKWFMTRVYNWIHEEQMCMWLHGFAGSGKTVIAAMAIEKLQAEPIFDESLMLHFFCDRQDPHKQSLQDLLHAIVKQLLDQNQACIAEAKRWRDERVMSIGSAISKPLALSEYISLIRKLCLGWKRVVLVIDALDECSDVDQLVDGLMVLAGGSNLRLLLTSRFDVEMQRAIEPLASLQVSLSECMQDDIRTYLISETRTLIARRTLKFRSSDLEQKIVSELAKKADGMILLAKLHLDYICALKSDRAIYRGRYPYLGHNHRPPTRT